MVEARKRLASGAPPQEPEEDFPRGGGSALTALERRQLRQEAAAEAERDFAAGGGSGRKRRKTTRGNEVRGLYASLQDSQKDHVVEFVFFIPSVSHLSPICDSAYKGSI